MLVPLKETTTLESFLGVRLHFSSPAYRTHQQVWPGTQIGSPWISNQRSLESSNHRMGLLKPPTPPPNSM